jgi:hypothetical protein
MLEYSAIEESFPGMLGAPGALEARPNNGWYTEGGGRADGCVVVEPSTAGWARQLEADGGLPAAVRQFLAGGFRPGNNRPDAAGLVPCRAASAGGQVNAYCLARRGADEPFDPKPWTLVTE